MPAGGAVVGAGQAEGGLGGVLEDRTAQAVDGEGRPRSRSRSPVRRGTIVATRRRRALAARPATDLGQVVAVEAQVVSGSRRSIPLLAQAGIPIGITRCRGRRGIRRQVAGRVDHQADTPGSQPFLGLIGCDGRIMAGFDFEVSRSQGGFRKKSRPPRKIHPRGGICLLARHSGASRTRASRPGWQPGPRG